MSSPLAGAWELVSDTHQGVMVCSETYYSLTIAPQNRQRIEEPTTDDMLESYRNVNAAAGTYTLSGSKATFSRTACIRVNAIDRLLDVEFEFAGDQLTWDDGNPMRPAHGVWRKVG